MKKMLILLAVATVPTTLSGCAACCPTGLCPGCPCNWFNRPAPCPPAPYCPPAPTYAAPLAATACPPAPAQMMPQYVMPPGTPYGAPYAAAPAAYNPCQTAVMAQPQPMYYQAQPSYYAEPSCGYVETGCGAPYMGTAGYGPSMMDYGPCSGGCCESGAMMGHGPERFIDPRPTE